MNQHFKEAMDLSTPVSPADIRDDLLHQAPQTSTMASDATLPVKEKQRSDETRAEAERKTESLRPLV